MQNQYDYKYVPDVLDLVIDKTSCSGVEVRQAETPFGKDEREFIYFEGTLLGELIQAPKYYEGFKIDVSGKFTMSLAPKIKENNYLEIPDSDKFNKVLRKFLKENKGWFLICERDCDQYDVIHSSSNEPKAEKFLSEMFIFLESGETECPTFLLQS